MYHHFSEGSILALLLFVAVASAQLVDPGIPVPNATVPGWFYGYGDEYNPRYQTIQSSVSLPSSADVTIIGAGWTGVSIAYYLSILAPHLKVVLLDARGIASGATGRNLGWMSPETYSGFIAQVEKIGLANAKAQIDFEDEVSETIKTLSTIFGWNDYIELQQAGQVRIYRAQSDWDQALLEVAAYQAAGYTDVTTYTAAQCNDMFGITNAVGCTKSSKAYKFRPSAFVWKLLEQTMQLNKNNLNVQSNTPVTTITPISGAAPPLLPNVPYLLQPFRAPQFTISTPRGNFTTNSLVHATNGWVAHLLQNLQYGGANPNYVFPVSQPIIQTNLNLPVVSQYCIEFAPQQYGLQQRKSGGWIVGQGWNPFISDDSYNPADQPTFDDSLNFARTVYPAVPSLQIAHQWTGIQGYTQSGYPYTGPINGQGPNRLFSHQWISAGLNGHGNPRAFGLSRALVKEMLFGIVEPGLPTIYQTNLIPNF